MKRRLLRIEPAAQRWRLETLHTDATSLVHDPREDYFVLSGETLCQYLLRRDPGALVIARGPLPFISGNKVTLGYLSPLTGLPHYSFVGGRAAAQLLNLGLDAICFESTECKSQIANRKSQIVVVSGRAPNLTVEFKPADELPSGQRSAFYRLMEQELGGDAHAGSIFTLGEAAQRGYASANVAVEAIYHAGRGGAGIVFARYARALVLRGAPLEATEFFASVSPPPLVGEGSGAGAFARNPNAAIAPLVDKHCARMMWPVGGTIVKLFATGARASGQPTLPAANARRLGYPLADLGGPKVLKATRHGHTGCHWCQVDCRHWHWVPADYAPGGRDAFLDDFEPTYAILAMLGLEPNEGTFHAWLDLLAEADRRLMLPIEQMGCDAMNIGLALAALFEGVERGLIPPHEAGVSLGEGGMLDAAARAVEMLRSGEAEAFPALRAVGDGPQALAERYPGVQEIVFTCGPGTLGNAGHCNALWTFLMPFSRFFGHYVGQLYKIDAELPPPGADEAAFRACFERVIERMLQKEFFWILCNALSQCAFTFVIFSQDGRGERLSDDGLLVKLLREYGVHVTRADLEWFGQAFWAQSIALKQEFGWRPPSAADLPRRVYEALSPVLRRSPEELQSLMELLIAEWKRQAGAVMARFGYELAAFL